ncbi:MAG: transporter [Phycisphaerales bacterium]|nr:transporter [Phycisphaerales bacterium]MDB5357439.1 transporter [Phycisphaerales bacterium]
MKRAIGKHRSTWRVCIGASILLVAAGPAVAADTWITASSGIYSVPANWSANAPPGAGDMAIFNAAATYAVTFPSSANVNQLLVDNGQVTFNLQGHTYSLASTLNGDSSGLEIAQTPGNTASLTFGSGTLQADYGIIGAAAQLMLGGNGTVTVQSGGVLKCQGSFTPSAVLTVGSDATGALNLNAGGQAQVDNLSIANGSSMGTTSTGTVNVAGAGASLQVGHKISLGDHPGGLGSLNVTAGASISSNQLVIGSDGGTGHVVVDGAGSIANLNNLSVGDATTGTLDVRNGGQISLVPSFVGFGGLTLGAHNGGNGTLFITGTNSRLSAAGDLDIGFVTPLNAGDHSTATFKVVGGRATISIGGNLVMGGMTTGALSAVIDSSGLSSINVAGSASLTGDMDVQLSGFTPAFNQQFTVLTAQSGIIGSLHLAGPDAADFLLRTSGNSLILVYDVPEPSPAMLAPTIGALGLLANRRRTDRRRQSLG